MTCDVARLFGRARAAGISLLLGTHELADLNVAADCVREHVLGNVEAVIAHRQNVLEPAELLARVAGTRPAWVTTDLTATAGRGRGRGRGKRRRGYEFWLNPASSRRSASGRPL